MKTKYFFLITIAILIIIIFKQHEDIRSLQMNLGSNYQSTIRNAINVTGSVNQIQLAEYASDQSLTNLYRLSNSLLSDSEALNRIPNNDITTVSETLRDLAIKIEKTAHNESNISEIIKSIKTINKYLIYIDSKISDSPIDWYKEFHKKESTILNEANELLIDK